MEGVWIKSSVSPRVIEFVWYKLYQIPDFWHYNLPAVLVIYKPLSRCGLQVYPLLLKPVKIDKNIPHNILFLFEVSCRPFTCRKSGPETYSSWKCTRFISSSYEVCSLCRTRFRMLMIRKPLSIHQVMSTEGHSYVTLLVPYFEVSDPQLQPPPLMACLTSSRTHDGPSDPK